MPTESIMVRMGLNTAPFRRNMALATSSVMRFKAGMNSLGAGIGLLGIIALARYAANAAATLKRTAEAVGETVEEVQMLGYAASQNGSDVETMSKALEKLTVNLGLIAIGDTEAIEKFEQFGIAIRGAGGEMLSTSEVLDNIADKMQNAAPGQRAVIAYETLGRSGVKLVQTLADGAEGLARLKQEAEATGQVVSGSANDAIVELSDTLDRHLGGALKTVVGLTGDMLLGLKQAAIILGTVFHDFNPTDMLTGWGKIQAFRKIANNFGAGIEAAAAAGISDDATKAVQDQMKAYEAMGPLLDKIAKLEKEREMSMESSADKLDRLKNTEKELADILLANADEDVGGNVRLLNTKARLLETQKELQKEINNQLKEETQLRERSNALQSQLAGQIKNLATTKGNRSLFTMEELAGWNLQGSGKGGVMEDARKARQFMDLTRQAEAARFNFGDVAKSRRLFAQADKVRDSISNLRSTERPFKGMEEGIKGMKTELQLLTELASGQGINLNQVILS